MRLVPKSIEEIVQIATTLYVYDFSQLRAALHKNLEDISVDVYSSPEEKTVFFKNLLQSYQLITVGEGLVLIAVFQEGSYELLFSSIGNSVRFVFQGKQEHFMCESMQEVLSGIEWNRLVTRSKLELIQY
jgi:hypothetical protein